MRVLVGTLVVLAAIGVNATRASAGPVSAAQLVTGRIVGINPDMQAAIARTGDVNGDHRPDLAIADFNSVRVVFAPARHWQGTIDVRHLGTHGFTIKGKPGGGLGMFISGAGDFNGDGLRDILATSLFAYPDEFGGTSEGPMRRPEFIVVYGKRGTRTVDLRTPGSAARVIKLPLSGTGTAVGVGDANADGFDDVLVAQDYESDGLQAGAYVVFGGKGTATIDLARPAFPGFFIKTVGHHWVWSSVAAAGDQNGDGLADVVVGPAGGHPVDVVFGKRSRSPVDTAHLGRRGFRIAPSVDLAHQVGDVNGDGRTDLMSLADVDFKGRQRAGAGFVLFGRRPPTSVDMTALGVRGLTIGGRIGESGCTAAEDGIVDCAVESEGMDHSTSLGDLNSDGFGDIAIGTRVGRVYVIHGAQRGRTLDLRGLARPDYVITPSKRLPLTSGIAWVGGRTLAVLGSGPGRRGQQVMLLELRR